MSYCIECGAKLELKELKNEGMIPFCPTCNQYRFKMFNTAVSMIVRDSRTKEILLIQQYGRKDNILVAGYVNLKESLEEAVVREVYEETGMKVEGSHFNRSRYFEKSNTLMCNFTVYANKEDMHPNEEIDDYHWYLPEDAKRNIKPDSLAKWFLERYLEDEAE